MKLFIWKAILLETLHLLWITISILHCVCVCVCVFSYIYIYIYREREREILSKVNQSLIFQYLLYQGVGKGATPFPELLHLPLIHTLCWVLSKEASSTISFLVFGMTQPGIEPRSLRPLVNTLTIMHVYIYIYICVCGGSPWYSGWYAELQHHSKQV